jgi:hypothetical protein
MDSEVKMADVEHGMGVDKWVDIKDLVGKMRGRILDAERRLTR